LCRAIDLVDNLGGHRRGVQSDGPRAALSVHGGSVRNCVMRAAFLAAAAGTALDHELLLRPVRLEYTRSEGCGSHTLKSCG